MITTKIDFGKEKLKRKNEIARLTKEIQLDLIKILLEKGHNNPKDIAKLWDIDFDTAKKYIQESKNIKVDERVEPDIEKIKSEKKVSWLEAVSIYYKELLRPKCGYCH